MASKRQRLAQRRKAAGFTQEQFAERLGVERSTVARWDSAETEPQPWLRPNLARALGVSLVELDGLLADVVSVVSKTSERPCAGADPCNADLAAVMDGLGSALTVYRPINIPAGNGSSYE
jgi:transcriptional regulator with XRE-family HTH domain